MLAAHGHSQQWEHVWMAETFPRHHLLAEPLRDLDQYLDTGRWEALGTTYLCDLIKIAC